MLSGVKFRIPPCSDSDAINRSHGNAQLGRQFPSTEAAQVSTNVINLLPIQFREPRFSSSHTRRHFIARSAASFFEHIGHIVGLCSKEQMVWTNTRPVVAAVKHLHTDRDYAIRNHPCDSVGAMRLRANPNHSVTAVILAARPQPASIGFVNFGPKISFIYLQELLRKGIHCDWKAYRYVLNFPINYASNFR